MSKKLFITIIIALLVISFAVIVLSGSRYTVSYAITQQDPDDPAQDPGSLIYPTSDWKETA